MKTLCTALVLGLFAAAAHAQQGGAAQQKHMKDCNTQATQKNLKGDERQKFMSSCLSAAAQQDRMNACSKRAGEQKLKGDARKKFMNRCARG
jgi:psiF repeat-containing protein